MNSGANIMLGWDGPHVGPVDVESSSITAEEEMANRGKCVETLIHTCGKSRSNMRKEICPFHSLKRPRR